MGVTSIPYGHQQITEADIKAVVAVLKSEYLTQGPRIDAFEKVFANYIGSKYAVAVANGTAALHLSAIALGVVPGKRVISSPLTFAASTNCVLYCGGTIEFCDIDPQTLLLDINLVRKKLESSPKDTYAGIIPVDFAGAAVDMEAFRLLADEFNLFLLEDSCHAPGGYFIDSKGQKQFCGNCNYADAAIFSFHPVKHITCGEGGMITTNNSYLAQQSRKFAGIGYKHLTANAGETHLARNEVQDPSYARFDTVGFNYRMNDIQAGLGLSQLKRLELIVKERNTLFENYKKNLLSNDLRMIEIPDGVYSALHLAILRFKEFDLQSKLYENLRKSSIGTQVHYIPVHLQPYYKNNFGFKEGDFPESEYYSKTCLSLPLYSRMQYDDQSRVIESILTIVGSNY